MCRGDHSRARDSGLGLFYAPIPNDIPEVGMSQHPLRTRFYRTSPGAEFDQVAVERKTPRDACEMAPAF